MSGAPPPPPETRQPDDAAWPPRPPQWRHDAPDPPDAFPVPWGVMDAVGLVLWTIVAQLIVALPLLLLPDVSGVGFTATALFLVEIVTMAGVWGWLRGRGAFSWRLLGPVRPAVRHLGVGVGVGIAGFVIAVILPEILRRAFDLAPPESQEVLDVIDTGSGAALVGLVVVVVVLAPIVEELVYRSVLFQALRHRLGLWPGIGLSSLTFAFVHLELIDQPVSLAALLVLAVWLAASFHRTGSLVVPIVAHATFNAINVAALLTLTGG